MPETERQQTERILRELLAKANAEQDDAEASSRSLLSGHFAKPARPRLRKQATGFAVHRRPPQRIGRCRRKRNFQNRRTRPTGAATSSSPRLGVTLGLICALFPWYIFFNQEQFGVQAIKFGGTRHQRRPDARSIARSRRDERAADGQGSAADRQLDLFATGTLCRRRRRPERRAGPRPAAFPGRDLRLPPGPRRQRPRHDRGRYRPVDRPARLDAAGHQPVVVDRAAQRQMGHASPAPTR